MRVSIKINDLNNRVINVNFVNFSEIIEYLNDLVVDQGYLSKSLQLQTPPKSHSKRSRILAK